MTLNFSKIDREEGKKEGKLEIAKNLLSKKLEPAFRCLSSDILC